MKIVYCSGYFKSVFIVIVSRVLKVVEKDTDTVDDGAPSVCNSSDDAGCSNNTSAGKLNTTPYRLTEQFVINVQKDAEPKVRFYSA